MEKGLKGVLQFLEQIQFFGDIIVNPMAIPPLYRIDRYSTDRDRKMEVISSRKPRLARITDNIPFLHFLSGFQLYGALVSI